MPRTDNADITTADITTADITTADTSYVMTWGADSSISNRYLDLYMPYIHTDQDVTFMEYPQTALKNSMNEEGDIIIPMYDQFFNKNWVMKIDKKNKRIVLHKVDSVMEVE